MAKRILVCGGRDYLDYLKVQKTLDEAILGTNADDVTIIQGGARGADFLAKVYAYCWGWGGLNCIEYPADWHKNGRAAGHIRNKQMLEEGKPDLVIAFPGGRGTADMIRQAKEAGVEVVEVA
jgi:hypothetical protein